jgi:hypothetical protein
MATIERGVLDGDTALKESLTQNSGLKKSKHDWICGIASTGSLVTPSGHAFTQFPLFSVSHNGKFFEHR